MSETNTIHKSFPFRLFDYVNYGFLGVLSLITFYPFWYVIVVSISTQAGYSADPYHIIPNSFSMETDTYIMQNPELLRACWVSVSVTAGGTLLSLLLTSLAAYPLSRAGFSARNFFTKVILFTMFFNGGVIPWYIVVNSVGLRNSILAYVVPAAINTFYLIIMRNYFGAIPESLVEAAKIDGCNEFQILFRIVLPISMPIVTTLLLFYAVFFWNDFFLPMLFASSSKNYTLALVLRNMIIAGSATFASSGTTPQDPIMVRAGIIVVSIVPIMLVYPFIQKYFVQGVMLGAVKE